MKAFTILLIAAIVFSLITYAQRYNPLSKTTKANMDTAQFNNPTVKKAIDAFQKGDKKAWYALFTADAQLLDDGNKIDFKNFSEEAIGHEHFTSFDKIEHNGLHIYGKFHSDKWGNFKTYFKFTINKDGKINVLEIGQAKY
ncbi:hypothetical protein [Pedobacter sp. UBA5917]|jgi:hypothetical protein|uniref:hypothetical protein n=1 Tax=Pedobacter sp. UBA5917 TaxID=1947061 RepID=UPI0025D9AA9E|nr:hypothetical protein [Pedobacter sp. UBA5917]